MSNQKILNGQRSNPVITCSGLVKIETPLNPKKIKPEKKAGRHQEFKNQESPKKQPSWGKPLGVNRLG